MSFVSPGGAQLQFTITFITVSVGSLPIPVQVWPRRGADRNNLAIRLLELADLVAKSHNCNGLAILVAGSKHEPEHNMPFIYSSKVVEQDQERRSMDQRKGIEA